MNQWPTDYREQFWNLYPRRIAKGAAMKALERVHKRGDVPWAQFTTAIARYTEWLTEPGWRPEAKHPATWLNAGCWDDELQSTPARQPVSSNGFAAVRRSLMN